MTTGDTLRFMVRMEIDACDCHVIELIPIDSSGVTGPNDFVLMGWRGETRHQDILGNIAVDVSDSNSPNSLPGGSGLSQNYLNPFNPVTSIEFAIPRVNHVSVDVFGVLGRRVMTLASLLVIAMHYMTEPGGPWSYQLLWLAFAVFGALAAIAGAISTRRI